MNLRRNLATAIVACGLIAGTAALAAPPVEWDGMQRVSSKRFDHAYLAPGVDFRGYTKVIIEPTEVAFRKNWRRDQNSSSSSLAGRVSERDVQEAVTKGVAASTDIISDAWRKGGYAVVDSPAADTLKVRTGVVNISVSSPELRTAGPTYSFAQEAGQATFVVELRTRSPTRCLVGRSIPMLSATIRLERGTASPIAETSATWWKSGPKTASGQLVSSSACPELPDV